MSKKRRKPRKNIRRRRPSLEHLENRHLLAGPGDLDLSHVGHVEEAGAFADRLVLFLDRAVLDRHLEAGEGDQSRPQACVGRVERRAAERAHAPSPAVGAIPFLDK